MIKKETISNAKEHFGKILQQQANRIERIKNESDFIAYKSLDELTIGIIGGDGIGPAITQVGYQVLKNLLHEEISSGRIKFKIIEGLTIENRAKHLQAIPDAVLEQIKQCHVTLKGPTTTPEKGDSWPNIESANVALRKSLDLFANVRPVRIPSEKIDWTFFRENTEDLYALGSQGIDINDDFSIDFR